MVSSVLQQTLDKGGQLCVFLAALQEEEEEERWRGRGG